MNVEKLLSIVKNRGLSLRRRKDQLLLIGPDEEKTQALKDKIKANRDEILKVLGYSARQWAFITYTDNGQSITRAMPLEDLEGHEHFWWVVDQRWVNPRLADFSTRMVEGEPEEWTRESSNSL